MSDYSIVPNAALTATADAIRTKSGSQATIEFDNNTGFKGAVDAISTGSVTSVDGKTGAVTILPTGGTTGQTLEKTSGSDYQVKWGNKVSAGVVDTLNPFSPVLNFLPRIDRLENALYFADKRWTVTGYKEEIATGIQTDLNASSLANLFDFNSSSCIGIDDGYKIVVTIDFGSPNGVFPNYPYGVLCISFYYNNSPASVSARVYGKHTGNTWYWSNLTVNDVSADGTHIQYQANQNGMYNMQKLEVTVIGQTAGSSPGYTQINDISYYLNRGTKNNDMPYVSKLREEKLYYNLTVPNLLLDDGTNVKAKLNAVPSTASDVGAEPAITEVTVSTAGAITQALDARKIYHFTGDLTALTITLNSASEGQLAQYHFDFNCGSTPPTVTIPNTVTMPDYQSYIANKHYEIDILNGYGVVIAWTLS